MNLILSLCETLRKSDDEDLAHFKNDFSKEIKYLFKKKNHYIQMEQQLRRLNVPQLKFIAKELKIKGRSRMFKANLINELEKFTDVDIDKLITKAIIMYNYPCVHGIKKYFCKECGGSQICIHEKIKYQCKECGGSQICVHRKRKSYCVLCDGSQICFS